MNHQKHIAFICSRLDLPGGTERAVVNTANLFASKGHAITILILDEASNSFYPLNNSINVIQKNLHLGITPKGNFLSRKFAFVQHIWQLRKLLQQTNADCIIATEYVFAIAAQLALGKKKKLMAWEHHHFHWLKRNRFWQTLFTKIYPGLHKVVCLNAEEERLFQSIGCKTVVIPNFIEKGKKAEANAKNILTVGWLIKRKGVDMIPSIAEKVFAQFPSWHWNIIGSGEEERNLIEAINKKNLAQNISVITPTSHDLSKYYSNSASYVMTSRFECFPMVLLEAMAHGIPCVAFDCPTGPGFIIHHHEDGLLVKPNDTDAMAKSIIQLIANEEKRKTLGDHAYQNIERFSPENIYQQWQKIL